MSDKQNPFATNMSLELEQEILQRQVECTFVWRTQKGDGRGAMMSFLYRDDRLWLSTNENNLRVKALKRSNKACVVISSTGLNLGLSQSVTLHGEVFLHGAQDVAEEIIFSYCKKLFPDSEKAVKKMQVIMGGDQQVWIEFIPQKKICYDGDRLMKSFV